jgi:hypothetical protein
MHAGGNGSCAAAATPDEQLEALVAEGKALLREGRELARAGADFGRADALLQDAMAAFEDAAALAPDSIKVQARAPACARISAPDLLLSVRHFPWKCMHALSCTFSKLALS